MKSGLAGDAANGDGNASGCAVRTTNCPEELSMGALRPICARAVPSSASTTAIAAKIFTDRMASLLACFSDAYPQPGWLRHSVPDQFLPSVLAGLLSFFGAGLLSDPEGGLPSPPGALEAAESFLAASLYFSLR